MALIGNEFSNEAQETQALVAASAIADLCLEIRTIRRILGKVFSG